MNTTAEKFPGRNEYLGASEIASALGLNPWKTPLDLYLEKTGDVAPPDLSDNQAVHFGTILEDVVATEFTRRTGLEVRRDNREFISKEIPFLRGHIDRKVTSRKEGLECKTASIRMSQLFGDEGTDEVPVYYLAQCLGYLEVTGWDNWHVAALIGGNDYRTYTIKRDEKAIDFMRQALDKFWLSVKTKTPPDPINLSDLNKLYLLDSGQSVEATIEISNAVADLANVKSSMKELDDKKSELELAIKKFMADNATLVAPDGKILATWKTAYSSRLDTTSLKKAMPEIAEKFTAKQAQRRFLVK